MSDAYYALALQLTCQSVNPLSSREDAQISMRNTIAHTDYAISGAVGFHGDIKLVTLPEYFLTGHPAGESLAEWRHKAAIDMHGEEIDALAEVANRHQLFLAGNAYEADPSFPELYFQTSFILDPSGECVLKYRRLISMYTPSPYDVLDKYLDLYGKKSLFPVADTAIGKLAAIASEEVLYPEIVRCFAMQGAEVFVHSSSEAALRGLSPKSLAKRARAMENIAYVVSANSAGLIGGPMLKESVNAGSQIVDFNGRVIIETESGECMNAVAEIDLNAVRRARRRVGMSNFLARQPTSLYADAYADFVSPQQPNGFNNERGEPVAPNRSFFRERQSNAIERLIKKGVI